MRLLDYEPEDPDARKQPPYLTGYLYNGYYFRKKKARSATIALYTNDLYLPIPKLLVLSPVARLRIAEKLAHEVGHHVIATRGLSVDARAERKRAHSQLVDPDEEAAADQYAAEVVSKMLQSGYYKFGRFLARTLSSILFTMGDRAHWKGDFKSAARLEFRAYILNHENGDAWQAYLQDKAELVKTASALTDAERLCYIIDAPSPVRTLNTSKPGQLFASSGGAPLASVTRTPTARDRSSPDTKKTPKLHSTLWAVGSVGP